MMDPKGTNVRLFLKELQDGRFRMEQISDYWEDLFQIRCAFVTTVSSRPFRIIAAGADARKFEGHIGFGLELRTEAKSIRYLELIVSILWDEDYWYVQTEISDVSEDNGVLAKLCEFPERRTANFEECLLFIRQAINDLASCRDLVRRAA